MLPAQYGARRQCSGKANQTSIPCREAGNLFHLEHRVAGRQAILRVMFRLVTTMKQGTASGLPAAAARYPTVEAAREGAAELFRNDRVLRVVIVRNEIPPSFVEWRDR